MPLSVNDIILFYDVFMLIFFPVSYWPFMAPMNIYKIMKNIKFYWMIKIFKAILLNCGHRTKIVEGLKLYTFKISISGWLAGWWPHLTSGVCSKWIYPAAMVLYIVMTLIRERARGWKQTIYIIWNKLKTRSFISSPINSQRNSVMTVNKNR